ncbi:MAG: HD domain-containing phosphohydrolase [Methylococcaceae bacterium]
MKEKIISYIERFKNTRQTLDPADERLKKLDINFARTLSRIIESFPCIHEQSKYIVEKSLLVGGGLGLNAEEIEDIFYAGFLIQLGKITLPKSLLTKPFFLMPSGNMYEYLGHAVESESLLHELTQFKGASTLIMHQYEQYNGQGFPSGRMGLDIPIGSRIICVVRDYIEYLNGSMTGLAMSANDVRSQLIIRKGSHYDPDVVDVFLNVLKGATVEEAQEELAKSKLAAKATEHWKKGLVISKNSTAITNITTIVEISLQQLKVGMKVDSIYFGFETYIGNCIADQSIINGVIVMQKNKGKNPIIKIRHDS